MTLSSSEKNEQKAGQDSIGLAYVLATAARLQNSELDRLRLHDAVSTQADKIPENEAVAALWEKCLSDAALGAGVDAVEWSDCPDPAKLPAVCWLAEFGWCLVRAQSPSGGWVIDAQGRMLQAPAEMVLRSARLIIPKCRVADTDKPAYRLIYTSFSKHWKAFLEGAAAGVLINILALGTSLYSMQVYDRVIPTQGYATLIVLTLGVGLAMVFELLLKVARSYIIEEAAVSMDGRLSREIFTRLLNIRLDQLPGTVGSLSAQLRGYETIRSFLSASTFYVLVDAPFGIIFIFVIAMISSPIVAFIPLFFLVLSAAMGLVMRKKVDMHAQQSNNAANLKTGILVEAIEGAETIKAGGGGWNFLSKWVGVTEESIHHDMSLRGISDKSTYITAMMHQISYVGLIAVGAYFAAEGQLTMGALIACSILSGRVLAPIAAIPGLMVQFAHAKAALVGLEKVFSLKSDNHEVDRPLIPEKIHGGYHLDRIRFAYPGSAKSLTISRLLINPGEKIGVVGPIGAGKTTLLKILSGMYHPNEGRVLLDGLDIGQISRSVVADRVGYLQQEHRLFNGTLRENLLVGVPDPGDEAIKIAAEKTGLWNAIAGHPKGLDLLIAEGGRGLSGGQRQLVALTRLLLGEPNVWLLDEPTASMDEQTEQQCLQTLQQTLKPENTLVLVTHKFSLLRLVDRLIVVANEQIVADGPRDQVLQRVTPQQTKETQNTQVAG